MKTFEEKWTAWLDDQLGGRELSEFEASLPDKAAAQAEKAEAKKLGELLKLELRAHPLKNEEFFSHQLRERIFKESGEQHQERARRSPTSSWWTIPRLLWTGTASLAVFLICTVLVMSKFVQQNDTKERAIFQCCPNRIVIPVRESRHFKRSDNEPGEMQIHAYSCQLEYWQRAFHGHRGAGSLNINNCYTALPRGGLFF